MPARVPEWLAVDALIMIMVAAGTYLMIRFRIPFSATAVLLTAAAIRAVFAFQDPVLSDDIYRYVFDGMRLLSGQNPYGLAPLHVQSTNGAMAALISQINHPHLVTIYPPAAQLIFAAGAFTGGITGMKAIMAGIDVFSCWLIISLLRTAGISPWFVLLYAWHPLPAAEIAGSGHIDGACLCLTLFSFWLITRSLGQRARSWTFACLAGACWTGAVLTKLFPLVLLPAILLMIRPVRHRAAFLFSGFIFAVLLIWPFLPAIRNILPTLSLYVRHWEFSGLVFQMLRHATGSADIRRMAILVAFVITSGILYARLYRRLKFAEDVSGRVRSAFNACYGICLAYVLLTPTLHPWYALYLTGFLPFSPGPAGLVASFSVLLSYRVLIPYSLLGVWQQDLLTTALVWGAPATASSIAFFTKKFSKTSAPAFGRLMSVSP